jgi:flavin-dependent dehydrogenase
LAGAEFRPGTAVRAVEHCDGGVRVSAPGFEAEAAYLICADGAHSPVGKMAGLGQDIEECAAWELEVASPDLNASGYRARSLIELGYRPWGYAWLFPKRDLLSIGIVLPHEQAGSMKRRTAAFVNRLGLAHADVRMARGHKIRFRRGREAIANGHALLAGDAAGLADEFTEEGIFYAIESGRIAARSTLAALSGAAPLAAYQAAIDREVMPELHAARQIAFMFYGMLKRAPRAWMFASAHTPFLWNAFFAVQRGESTYARETARVPLLPGIADRMLRGR